jgi:NAD(P)-dependent dehydrogenase (short-subunit alcohol dehydrogenase family)
MRSTRDNLRKFNIRLNIVAPYMTRTPLGDAIPGLWEDLDRRGIPVQEPIWVARCVGTLAADERFHGNLPQSRSLTYRPYSVLCALADVGDRRRNYATRTGMAWKRKCKDFRFE